MADRSKDLDGASPRRPALRPFSGQLPTQGQGALRPLGARRPLAAPFAVAPGPVDDASRRRLTPPAVTVPLAEAESMPVREASALLVDDAPIDGGMAEATPVLEALHGEPGQLEAPTLEPLVASGEPMTASDRADVDAVGVAERTDVGSEEPRDVHASHQSAGDWPVHLASASLSYADDLWPHDLSADLDEAADASAGFSRGGNATASAFGVSDASPAAPTFESTGDVLAQPSDEEGSDAMVDVTADAPAETTAAQAAPTFDAVDGSLVAATTPDVEPVDDDASVDAFLAAEAADGAPQLLDEELSEFQLTPAERTREPEPIPGLDLLSASIGGATSRAWEPSDESTGPVPHAGTERPAEVAVRSGWGSVAGETTSPAGETEATSSHAAATGDEALVAPAAPRGATAPVEVLADSDASLSAFTESAAAHAHVVETLEAVARRVRSGEIVPVTTASATPEAVLASVLASLLARRT